MPYGCPIPTASFVVEAVPPCEVVATIRVNTLLLLDNTDSLISISNPLTT